MNCAKSSVTLDRLIEDLVAIRAEHGLGDMPVGFFSAKSRREVDSNLEDYRLVEHKLLEVAKLDAALGEPFLAFVLTGAEKDLGVRTQLTANLA
jgi:hypothetical protein